MEILNDFTNDRKGLLVTLQTLTVGEKVDIAGNAADANAADKRGGFRPER